MPIGSWGLRALFLGLVVAGGSFQLTGQTRPDATRFDVAVTNTLVRAGFQVTAHTQTWLKGEIKGTASLLARHRDCREPITVTSGSLTAPPPAGIGTPTYIYGDLHAPALSRLAILRETVRLELGWAMSLGRQPRPTRRLVTVVDPSACLLLTDPHWASIWTSAA